MARKQKLKVFKTSTGFHDAYIAAPSRKAALEAWGSNADLFARGVAEEVTDEELSREPLENPGKVIRRLRGTVEEHLAALPADKRQQNRQSTDNNEVAETLTLKRRPAKTLTGGAARAKADVRAASAKPAGKTGHEARVRPAPMARPPRAKLEEAEKALKTIVAYQERQESDIRDRLRAMDKERRELETAHERERRTAERAVKKEREEHSELLERWLAEQD